MGDEFNQGSGKASSGSLVAAANNRAFAERLVGVYRLAKAGVKHGRR